MKHIAIFLDKYSGHLFHDLELYIVAFERLVSKFGWTKSQIFFINEADNKTKFFKESIKIINIKLCERLFDSNKFFILDEKDFKPSEFCLVIKRSNQDKKNINKAFATSILDFPTIMWQNRICLDKIRLKSGSPELRILYSTRQSCNRRLSDSSHKYICELVKKYNGTILDAGSVSITDQINMFREHNCLIGVHGNNLSGIMWMKSNSHIFEILPFEMKSVVYDFHCLSLCMKSNYTQINCTGVWGSQMNIFDNSKELLRSTVFMLDKIHS